MLFYVLKEGDNGFNRANIRSGNYSLIFVSDLSIKYDSTS